MDDPKPNAACRRHVKELFEHHHAAIYRFMLRQLGDEEDAIDLTQETFLEALRSLAAHGLPERNRAWLFAIARHRAIDAIRKRRRNRDGQDHFVNEPHIDDPPTPFDIFLEGQRRAMLQGALADIQDQDIRRTAELYYGGEQVSFEEVAQQLGVSRNTVSTRISRIKSRIKMHLIRRLAEDKA